MKKGKNILLQYVGIILIVLSLVELVLEILQVLHLDLLGLATSGSLSELFYFAAGNAGVSILFSVVGLAAGYVGFAVAEKDSLSRYLRPLGYALIAIYVIEGFMIVSQQSSVYSWARIIILLVLAVLYVWGALQTEKKN